MVFGLHVCVVTRNPKSVHIILYYIFLYRYLCWRNTDYSIAQSVVAPLIDCLWLVIQYIYSCPLYLEAFISFLDLKTRWWHLTLYSRRIWDSFFLNSIQGMWSTREERLAKATLHVRTLYVKLVMVLSKCLTSSTETNEMYRIDASYRVQVWNSW